MTTTSPIHRPLEAQSYEFALGIVRFSQKLIEEKKEYILSKQLMRAGTSVGANIEEAHFAQSRGDVISKLSIALKEATETRYWLRLLTDTQYARPEDSSILKRQAENIISILVASIKTAKKNSVS